VRALPVEGDEMPPLRGAEFLGLAAKPAFPFRDSHASRVRMRMTSASNSATTPRTLKSSLPTGSVGTQTDRAAQRPHDGRLRAFVRKSGNAQESQAQAQSRFDRRD